MPGYVTILRRHIALVLLLGLIGLLAGVAAAALREPRYEAVADVQLEQVESPFRSSGGTRGDLTRAVQTQIDIATGDAARDRVVTQLGTAPPITVLPKGERDELQFFAVASTGERAAAVANAWASAYVAVLRADQEAEAQRYLQAFEGVYSRVYDQIAAIDVRRTTATDAARGQLDLERDVLVTQLKALAGRRTPEGTSSAAQIIASPVREAVVPEKEASALVPRLLALGLIGGLLLGYLLAVLKESRRDQVRSDEDVALAAPGAAVLRPLSLGHTGADGAVLLDSPSTMAEFSLLRAELSALVESADASSVIAITSASGEAQVAEVAAGLALALSRAGRRVVLVDADLMDPLQHVLLSTGDGPGLAEVVDHGLPLPAALVPVPVTSGPPLRLLPAGIGRREDLVALPSFRALVRSLAADPEYDTVLIAAPPLLETAAGLAVAEAASAVLVVAAPRQTRRRDLAAALNRLGLAAPAVSAVVLAHPQDASSKRRIHTEPARKRRAEAQVTVDRSAPEAADERHGDARPVESFGRPR